MHNPDGWIRAIEDFLNLPPHALDVGYSLPLQKEALAQGSDASAARFLSSERIQEEITAIFNQGQASNLDAERMVAQTRHQERDKALTIASASRNMILSRYQKKN